MLIWLLEARHTKQLVENMSSSVRIWAHFAYKETKITAKGIQKESPSSAKQLRPATCPSFRSTSFLTSTGSRYRSVLVRFRDSKNILFRHIATLLQWSQMLYEHLLKPTTMGMKDDLSITSNYEMLLFNSACGAKYLSHFYSVLRQLFS